MFFFLNIQIVCYFVLILINSFLKFLFLLFLLLFILLLSSLLFFLLFSLLHHPIEGPTQKGGLETGDMTVVVVVVYSLC